MSEERLAAGFWVKAHIRRCAVHDVPVFVVRRGHEAAGIVLIKLHDLSGNCRVLTPVRHVDGQRAWLSGTGIELVSEEEANTYIEKQVSIDPDIWVIEIEDREGRHFLDEPVDP